MSNRKRPRNRKLIAQSAIDRGLIDEVPIPMQELSVHKRVPATIHWSTVNNVDRTDSEVIGEAVIYDDGTSDIIVFDNISQDAKNLVYTIKGELDHLDMSPEED